MPAPSDHQHPSPAMAARGLGVTFGGQALLGLGAAAALAELGRAARAGRRPRTPALLALASAVAYETRLVPWMRSWGATPRDLARPLPGDELVADPGIVVDHAVPVAAPAGEVWPWLAQIGQDRGGFYSYEWLENLAGCRMRNADRIHREWQSREVGEGVWLHPAAAPLAVTLFEPGRAIGLEGWGVFLVEPDGECRSRLIARGRIAAGRPALLYKALLELPHFLMQRKMLLGIRDRAEAAHARAVGSR